jgi:hypothetical protein
MASKSIWRSSQSPHLTYHLTYFLTVWYRVQGDIEQMEAEEIGHAAAYEAHRIWIHNPQIYESVLAGTEQRREAFIALAIAEGV